MKKSPNTAINFEVYTALVAYIGEPIICASDVVDDNLPQKTYWVYNVVVSAYSPVTEEVRVRSSLHPPSFVAALRVWPSAESLVM